MGERRGMRWEGRKRRGGWEGGGRGREGKGERMWRGPESGLPRGPRASSRWAWGKGKKRGRGRQLRPPLLNGLATGLGTPPRSVRSNADGVGRNRDSEPIPNSIACCEREVQYTQPRQTSELMTLVAGERRSLFLTGDDDEVYDKKPRCYAKDNTAAFNCTQW